MSSILEQQFRSKWGVWAALGAGCLAGMSGLLLIQRLSLRIDHTPSQSLTHELSALHSTIQELRQEIKQIKKPTLKSALRTVTFSDVEQSLEEKELLSSSSISAVTSTSTTEYLSAISSDDEEFYDLPTDDNESGNRTPTNDNINQTNNLVTKALERLENELLVDQDVKDMRLFYHAVDELMEGSAEQQKQAFDLLKSRKSKLCGNAEFLWRMCKSMYLMAVAEGQSGDSAKKQQMIFDAVDFGEKALEIDEFNSEGHKWYAIVIGSRGEYLGIKEKILDGYEFKKHIDRASELAPQDHTIR